MSLLNTIGASLFLSRDKHKEYIENDIYGLFFMDMVFVILLSVYVKFYIKSAYMIFIASVINIVVSIYFIDYFINHKKIDETTHNLSMMIIIFNAIFYTIFILLILCRR